MTNLSLNLESQPRREVSESPSPEMPQRLRDSPGAPRSPQRVTWSAGQGWSTW